jgi:hypothetical protein
MTKKVLILSLNYSSTPSIALSGRINIAVNARGVFIADYGILEENITYLTDEWAPLTKAQIMTAIQALVDESTSLEEIYIYYAGYGSGIQIVKSIDWALMPVPMDIPPLESLPVDDSTITITIDELEPTTTESPSEATTTEPPSEATTTESPSEATTTESPSEATTTESPSETTTTESPSETTTTEPIVSTIDPLVPSFIVFPEPPVPPPPYKYDFYPMSQSYDKLTKQMVGSDYEIITNTEILDILKNTRCRTICVLDMCPLTNEVQSHLFVDGMTNDSLTWGTDIIGNVNIISFAEPDSISSGKLATIRVITEHIKG